MGGSGSRAAGTFVAGKQMIDAADALLVHGSGRPEGLTLADLKKDHGLGTAPWDLFTPAELAAAMWFL